MGESRIGSPAHAGQRPSRLFPRQHPGDPGLQSMGSVDGAHARGDLRLRLRVRRHRARWCLDAVPREGALRRFAVTVFGLIGAVVGGVMVLMFMFYSALGLTS